MGNAILSTGGIAVITVCVLIESQNQRAIITGDLFHHPCQIAEPSWTTTADDKPDKCVVTRQLILNLIADTDTLLIGSHFSDPVAGLVVRTDRGFMLKV